MNSSLKVSEYLASLYNQKEKIKILHYNASNPALKNELAQTGFENYLGVSIKKSLADLYPELYYAKDKNIVDKNNADILILNDADLLDIKKALGSAAELVIYQPKNPIHFFSYLPFWIYKYARRKKWNIQIHNFNDRKKSIIFNRRFEKEKKARHYLSPEAGLDYFFNKLNQDRLNYVVLRWYDKLPFLDLNEDIDLLVSDDDVEEVQRLLDSKVGIIPFDVYSVGGLPGSSFRNIAYYPPYLAERILEKRNFWKGKFYIPDQRHYFLSLLYHAVYHKGGKSGIPASKGEPADSKADHEYLNIVQRLAEENGIHLKEKNLMYFHQLLEELGWAPATDTMRKLTAGNEWLRTIVAKNKMNFEKNGEVMIFVIREWAVLKGQAGNMIKWLEKAGLNVVKIIELDQEQKRNAKQNLRGGNWGKGPWPVSGGDPAILLVMYDYHPKPLTEKQKKKYPHVSNQHYLYKEELRSEINSKLTNSNKTNPIHSSDDETEALDYIMAVSPESLKEIQETIKKWDQNYQTKETVIQDISENKRRAKVELISYNGKKAVKKTYKAGMERFLSREKYVYGELSKECKYIPKLLDSGENYIIIPYLKPLRLSENNRLKKRMLRGYKKEILSISEFFYGKGYALIDFHPGNILITKSGLKVIDFEFLYKYEKLPESLEKSFDFVGYPKNFIEDLPFGVNIKSRKKIWKKILY